MEPTIVVCIGQYYCSLCHLKFPFKSKLDRHLISENHLVFANCMQTMQGGIGADDEPSVAEEVWCICSLAICIYNKLVMFQSLMMPIRRRRDCLDLMIIAVTTKMMISMQNGIIQVRK